VRSAEHDAFSILDMNASLIAFFCMALLASSGSPAQAQGPLRTNHFNDPFLQATKAIARCPVPEGPLYTTEEVREVAHVRAQHGGSCYRAGRCRLPNSYLYDAEIIPRVALTIQQDGRFNDTSVWVLGERRLVTLTGCVQTPEQSAAIEKAVGLVDDVMGVINLMGVGTAEKPRYKVALPLAR
jgi:hypothetical protein